MATWHTVTSWCIGAMLGWAGMASGMVATASNYQEPNVPAHVIDGDESTRWSSQGYGEWVQIDMGVEQDLNTLWVLWLDGTKRSSFFDVALSLDGDNFWVVCVSWASFKSGDWEGYSFEAERARYIRIIGYGNDKNKWNSILEMFPELYTDPLVQHDIFGVQASHAQSPNVALNAADGGRSSRWSAAGPAWIQFDLGNIQDVSNVKIFWHQSHARRSYYKIEVSVDGTAWSQVWSGLGDDTVVGMSVNTWLRESVDARYVRVTGTGNNAKSKVVRKWVSINELQIWGAPGDVVTR